MINVMFKTEFLYERKNVPFLLQSERKKCILKKYQTLQYWMGAQHFQDIKGMKYKR